MLITNSGHIAFPSTLESKSPIHTSPGSSLELDGGFSQPLSPVPAGVRKCCEASGQTHPRNWTWQHPHHGNSLNVVSKTAKHNQAAAVWTGFYQESQSNLSPGSRLLQAFYMSRHSLSKNSYISKGFHSIDIFPIKQQGEVISPHLFSHKQKKIIVLEHISNPASISQPSTNAMS